MLPYVHRLVANSVCLSFGLWPVMYCYFLEMFLCGKQLDARNRIESEQNQAGTGSETKIMRCSCFFPDSSLPATPFHNDITI